MSRSKTWTSISVYTNVREQVEELRVGQSYNELFSHICEQYEPDEADHEYEYQSSENDKKEDWETISLHQSTYDQITALKQSNETFNDLFIKMIRQYNNPH